MKRALAFLAILVACASFGWFTGRLHPAAAATACGGNATVHVAPIDCVGSSTIDGTLVTAHIEESGGVLKVTFTLDSPRSTDTAIRIRWHVGFSSTGTVPAETQGVIPAGQTVGVLSVRSPVCAGQVDSKAIFIANGDHRGRVSAPWITDHNCSPPATTTPATSVPGSSVPFTTAPPSGGTTTIPPSSGPGTHSTSIAPNLVGAQLAATGKDHTGAWLAVASVALAVGAVLVAMGRRRARS